MDYLTQFVSIICYVGGALPQASIPQWLIHLQRETRCLLAFGRVLGKGFCMIKTTDVEALQNLMLLSPYRSPFGLFVFQRWMPNFDPNAECGIATTGHNNNAVRGLKIPIWITLRNLQSEFLGVAHQIVARVGEILGSAIDNSDLKDPRFCVSLQSGAGWEHSVTITNKHTQAILTVLIDYDHLLIRCCYCNDTTYCLRNCTIRLGPRRTHPQRHTRVQPPTGIPSLPASRRQQPPQDTVIIRLPLQKPHGLSQLLGTKNTIDPSPGGILTRLLLRSLR
jgi:hypothetical protein